MFQLNIRKASSRLILVIATLVSVVAWADDIRVRDAWSRPTPPGIEVGVAYFVIDNNGKKSDRLLGVSSPAAERTQLHRSKMEGGVMKMQHLDTVEVKPGESTMFSPNGRHVMLFGLKQPLKPGDSFPLTLNFENAGVVKVEVRIQEMGAAGESGRTMGRSQMDHPKMKH
jgi:hypothetical protein